MAVRFDREGLVRAAPWALPALALVLVLIADPTPSLRGPGWGVVGLLVAGAVAGLHRPDRLGALGPATAVVPAALLLLSPAGAAWLTLAVSAAGGATVTLARPVADRWRRVSASAGAHGLGALAAAWIVGGSQSPARMLLAGLPWAALVAAAEVALDPPRWRHPSRWAPPMAIDAVAWAAGTLLARTVSGLGPGVAVGLAMAGALLAAEAARQRHRAAGIEARLAELERVGRAGTRLARDASPLADVARRIHGECRQVVELSWFQFDLRAGGDAAGVWHAGPEGILRAGLADPPVHPPPLPGVHRRARWQLEERVLEAGDRHLATIRLWCDPRRVGARSVAHLDRLVPQLAGLVHRATLDIEARQDPLTGLASRRVLDGRLADAFARARAGEGSLAVALLDLDFFKRINDRHGHAAGDRALAAVAALLKSSLRDDDLCARFGGEEFTLLLLDEPGEVALGLADRLREAVEELVLEVEGERIPLTVSIGVAAYPETQCREATELMQLADAALYEAKRLGRNCALLVEGRGRYVDPKGRRIAVEEGGSAVKAPTLFA